MNMLHSYTFTDSVTGHSHPKVNSAAEASSDQLVPSQSVRLVVGLVTEGNASPLILSPEIREKGSVLLRGHLRKSTCPLLSVFHLTVCVFGNHIITHCESR